MKKDAIAEALRVQREKTARQAESQAEKQAAFEGRHLYAEAVAATAERASLMDGFSTVFDQVAPGVPAGEGRRGGIGGSQSYDCKQYQSGRIHVGELSSEDAENPDHAFVQLIKTTRIIGPVIKRRLLRPSIVLVEPSEFITDAEFLIYAGQTADNCSLVGREILRKPWAPLAGPKHTWDYVYDDQQKNQRFQETLELVQAFAGAEATQV